MQIKRSNHYIACRHFSHLKKWITSNDCRLTFTRYHIPLVTEYLPTCPSNSGCGTVPLFFYYYYHFFFIVFYLWAFRACRLVRNFPSVNPVITASALSTSPGKRMSFGMALSVSSLRGGRDVDKLSTAKHRRFANWKYLLTVHLTDAFLFYFIHFHETNLFFSSQNKRKFHSMSIYSQTHLIFANNKA